MLLYSKTNKMYSKLDVINTLIMSEMRKIGPRANCHVYCNETATTESYTYWHTRSLHDALPISASPGGGGDCPRCRPGWGSSGRARWRGGDRKSTRLNSSHSCASRMPSSA